MAQLEPPRTTDHPTSHRRHLRSARPLWSVVAATILALGMMTSALVASRVSDDAHHRAADTFDRLAADVTTSLQLELQHQNGLVVSAAAFVANRPEVDNAELRWWLNAVRARGRYPHLMGFAFIRVVNHEDLDAFAARVEADPDVDLGGDGFGVLPAGERTAYCFIQAVGYLDPRTERMSADVDVCADPGVREQISLPRRSGGSTYQSGIDVAGVTPLLITAPVYVTGFDPRTPVARDEAFVGSIAVQIDIERLLDDTIRDHPELGVSLHFADEVSDITFTGGSGAGRSDTQVVELMPGWTLTVAGDVEVVDDRTATTILVAGALTSMLVALLVFVLATGRARALDLVDEATAELRHRALHDPLTRLPNRALLLDRLDALLARSRRDGTTPAVLYLDLDGFKDVNDTHGHGAGDDLLRLTADRLVASLRGVDTIARLGGDEFVVLVDGAVALDAPEVVAERILEVLRLPFDVVPGGGEVLLSASVGIAAGARSEAETLLRDADAALYAAKAQGRDRWCAHGVTSAVPGELAQQPS